MLFCILERKKKARPEDDTECGSSGFSSRYDQTCEEEMKTGNPEKIEGGIEKPQNSSKRFYGFTPVHLSVVVYILHFSIVFSTYFASLRTPGILKCFLKRSSLSTIQSTVYIISVLSIGITGVGATITPASGTTSSTKHGGSSTPTITMAPTKTTNAAARSDCGKVVLGVAIAAALAW